MGSGASANLGFGQLRAQRVLLVEELRACGSVMELVRGLAKKGNARLEALGGGAGESELMRPSLMRIEYKVSEAKTGVKRRVQLTPQSRLADLKAAESLLVTRHGD